MKMRSQNSWGYNANIFLVILGTALFVGYLLLRPYLASVLVGGVLAAVAYPVYGLLCRAIRFQTIAALLTVALIFCALVIPLFFITKKVAGEAANVYSSITANGGAEKLIKKGVERAAKYVPAVKSEIRTVEINTYLKDVFVKVVERTGSIVSKTAQMALHIIIALFTLYYLLKDGKKLREYLMVLSPLKKAEDEKIFETIRTTITAIVRGSIVIGIIQGVLTGIGFWLFGVPNPALWGSVAILAAVIPGVGTALVNIPGVLFLAVSGGTTNAILLLLWALIAVGLIDNFLRPFLIGRDTKLHPFLVLLSVLGGIGLFGPVGFLIGPLILSFLLALLEIYPTIVSKS